MSWLDCLLIVKVFSLYTRFRCTQDFLEYNEYKIPLLAGPSRPSAARDDRVSCI